MKDHLIHKNCSFVNADCSSIAVRIRTKSTQIMWPSSENILLFSTEVVKDIHEANFTLFDNKDDIKEDINNYGTQSINGTKKYHWHRTVKPHYG